ncbi:MAG: imidazole glycerol phosphate synthase subunit HisH [Hyphomicrobium sp.]
MLSVAIVDYGSGNLHSAAKALERAARETASNHTILVTADPKIIRNSDRIVLPGVGAFADCKAGLDKIPDLGEALEYVVRKKGRPFLGICVGMQLMASRGLEHGTTEGLDWIHGVVDAISPDDPQLKIPHMGWNTLIPLSPHPLLKDLDLGPYGLHAYFVHSYHFIPKDTACIIAQTDYGGRLAAVIADKNISGTQFHPEKSQLLGLRLLGNFLSWDP